MAIRIHVALVLFCATWCTNAIKCVGFGSVEGSLNVDSSREEDWWVLLKAPEESEENNQYFLYVSTTFRDVSCTLYPPLRS